MKDVGTIFMQGKIFDTHAHYDDEAFLNDRNEILKKIKDEGVYAAVNAGVDILSSKESIKLSQEFDFIYAAVGVHPLNIENLDKDYLNILRKLVENKKNKIVAIGEIGLDYHTEPFNKDLQKKIFKEQILLANNFSLPVIIHSRDANSDSFDLIKECKPNGIVHCFSGNLDLAKELIKLGMYIGVGGVITFKNAQKLVEVVKNISLDDIVLETDCPYMAPVPFRGKRCDSSMIKHVAKKIADIKDESLETVLNRTKENAKFIFKV